MARCRFRMMHRLPLFLGLGLTILSASKSLRDSRIFTHVWHQLQHVSY